MIRPSDADMSVLPDVVRDYILDLEQATLPPAASVPSKDKIHDELAYIFSKYEETVDSYGSTVVPKENTDKLFLDVVGYCHALLTGKGER